ncbi:hypothetical protein F4778DRAFT_769829 [Xylariomycetidae sp. FL2044]|nr:hypothetical protein F4778DRAFT_769829 [Xylariomycetidae sp. FL2044]
MLASESCLCREEPLSVWNRCAPRVYICVVLCFPCDDERRDTAATHIESSLKRLAKERPIFAGRLKASSSGGISIHYAPSNDIPFEVLPTDEVRQRHYEDMRDRGFPPSDFISPQFAVSGSAAPGSGSIPMSKVQAGFCRGGLLLHIFLHHGLVDGGSLKVFLESFGAQTRNVLTNLPSDQAFPGTTSFRDVWVPAHMHDVTSFRNLVAKCPEYTILSDLSGPTQPRLLKTGLSISHIEKTGRIFVFKNERLQQLREKTRACNNSFELPSSYTCLAALAFAHITKARIEADRYHLGAPPRPTATLWNSVNWRTRAFREATGNYFGNAALPAVTKISMPQLMAACYDDRELARLVPAVKASIDVVDEEYVRRRHAMLSQVPDPRLVGVNYDPRMAEVLAFNTWRHFGADVEWSIPGVSVSKPDAIRRAHGGWNLGTALILPAKLDSPTQELFVSLSAEAMKLLLADGGWMQWVENVIG